MSRPETRGPIIPIRLSADSAPYYTVCLGCGCSVDDACLVDGVPCSWADHHHCTRCELLLRAGIAA